MPSISVTHFRRHSTLILAMVESGVPYTLRRRGREVARLAPMVERPPIVLMPARNPNAPRLSERANLPRRSAAKIDELVEWVKGDH